MYLGRQGYSIIKEELTQEQKRKIKKDLLMKPIVPKIVQTVTTFPIYRESRNKLYVPLYYGMTEFGDPKEIRLAECEDIDLNFHGEIRSYQNDIISKYMRCTEGREYGGGLLDVMTGSGKTVMALNIISRIKKKTLVIVHKSFLMNQWIERIEMFLPDAKVGKIQGENIDIEGKDIVIGMLQSLSMKEYHESTFESFGLLVCDEVHHLSAEVFVRALQKIVTRYTLGLSATMQRKDGLSKVFKMFLGGVIHKDERKNEHDVLINACHYETDDMVFQETKYDTRGNPLYSVMISKLCQYNKRTEYIVNVILKAREHRHCEQIMVLSHNKNLLMYIYKALMEYHDVKSVGYYLGGMKENDLKLSESKEVILATYAMASEGLDIKTLTTLIMATPKTDVTQSVGRILRKKDHQPIVFDIVDVHSLFQGQWKKRKAYYKKMGYSIHDSSNQDYNIAMEKMKQTSKENKTEKTEKKEKKTSGSKKKTCFMQAEDSDSDDETEKKQLAERCLLID